MRGQKCIMMDVEIACNRFRHQMFRVWDILISLKDPKAFTRTAEDLTERSTNQDNGISLDAHENLLPNY